MLCSRSNYTNSIVNEFFACFYFYKINFRCSIDFSGKNSSLGRTINRGMKSSPKSAVSQDKIRMDNTRNQPRSSHASIAAYDMGSPLLSVSINSIRKTKRRANVDLGTELEQRSNKVVENIGSSQYAVSTRLQSNSQPSDSCLPTSFGKVRGPSASRNLKFPQAYQEYGRCKSSSRFPEDVNRDQPFDICLSETTKQNILEPCSYEKLIQMERSIEETGQVLRPGMVLLKSCIPLSEQVDIVNKCRELGLGPGGFYRPGYQDGAKLRLYMMCLGLDWNPQTRRYQERRQHDDAEVPNIPREFTALVSRALDDSHNLIKSHLKTVNVEDILPGMSPDVCIVNFYTSNGRLGLHQDRDESMESLLREYPVVSLSVGDSAEFLYGDQRDVKKAEKVLLESGDVLIFGGKSRHIFHGVTSIVPNTAPQCLLENSKLRPGRLNLTFRKY